GADEQDVGLGDLDRVLVLLALARLDALVVVVDRDGEGALGVLLTDDGLLAEVEDLLRLGQLDEPDLGRLGELLLDDLVAQLDALVTDVDARARDQLDDLLLGLAAEGALQQVRTVTDPRHARLLPSRGTPDGVLDHRPVPVTGLLSPLHTTAGRMSGPSAASRPNRKANRHVRLRTWAREPCATRGPGRRGRTPWPAEP